MGLVKKYSENPTSQTMATIIRQEEVERSGSEAAFGEEGFADTKTHRSIGQKFGDQASILAQSVIPIKTDLTQRHEGTKEIFQNPYNSSSG
jgi:hypothetical protein